MYNYHGEPANDRSKIFIDNEEAFRYCINTGLISSNKTCCGENSMVIINKKGYINLKAYRCKLCKKIKNILGDKLISSPKLQLKDYFYSIYKFLELNFEKDVIRNANISKLTFQKIKSNINNFIHNEFLISQQIKLGGEGVSIQIDETVISHGVLIENPSNMEDESSGIIWLVGIIEQESKRIKLFIVENRRSDTFLQIFQENLHQGTVIISDGYSSYPNAVRRFGSRHIVVNHSRGFKNFEGFTTNNIENLWQLLKYEVKRRRGVLFVYAQRFIEEFVFRYNNLRDASQYDYITCFRNILEYLFEN